MVDLDTSDLQLFNPYLDHIHLILTGLNQQADALSLVVKFVNMQKHIENQLEESSNQLIRLLMEI